MKATGIVRRIDDLGRVVIPKEIRRTLRIRESDPLEIFTDREGEIILKKYSPMGELTPFAQKYAESMAQVSGMIAVIADRDQIIAVSGGMKDLLGKQISAALEEKMNNREVVMAEKGEKAFMPVADDVTDGYVTESFAPIICEGDMIGAVGLLGLESKEKMGDTEQKIIQAAASFLGKQMEQ